MAFMKACADRLKDQLSIMGSAKGADAWRMKVRLGARVGWRWCARNVTDSLNLEQAEVEETRATLGAALKAYQPR